MLPAIILGPAMVRSTLSSPNPPGHTDVMFSCGREAPEMHDYIKKVYPKVSQYTQYLELIPYSRLLTRHAI